MWQETGEPGLKITGLVIGPLGNNCYFLKDEKSNKALIVDPGDEEKALLDFIKKENLEIVAIINTHGHADHIGANNAIAKATNAPIYIHKADEPYFAEWAQSYNQPAPEASKFLEDQEELDFEGHKIKIIHTPGHTPGGVGLYFGNLLISGDTLFAGSIGRTDLPGGDFDTIIKSIKEKLMILPDDTIVLPGHGPESSVAWEKANNPYIR